MCFLEFHANIAKEYPTHQNIKVKLGFRTSGFRFPAPLAALTPPLVSLTKSERLQRHRVPGPIDEGGLLSGLCALSRDVGRTSEGRGQKTVSLETGESVTRNESLCFQPTNCKAFWTVQSSLPGVEAGYPHLKSNPDSKEEKPSWHSAKVSIAGALMRLWLFKCLPVPAKAVRSEFHCEDPCLKASIAYSSTASLCIGPSPICCRGFAQVSDGLPQSAMVTKYLTSNPD